MTEQDGVLAADIRALTNTVQQMRDDMREQGKTYITRAEYEAAAKGAETFVQGLAERVRKIEDRSEWLVRTVGGVIITALVTAFLVLVRTHGAG